MKAYAAFSREAGVQAGAVLVIANSVRQARTLAWPFVRYWNVEEWIDLAAHWLRDRQLLWLADQQKLALGTPHVIESPLACETCELWGCGITVAGLCCNCNGEPGAALVKLVEEKTNA